MNNLQLHWPIMANITNQGFHWLPSLKLAVYIKICFDGYHFCFKLAGEKKESISLYTSFSTVLSTSRVNSSGIVVGHQQHPGKWI